MDRSRTQNGSITVFLSLVLLLVISLIMTSLEAAKSAAARAFAQMMLSGAVESVAADFYRPLFDEYHLFGIDSGYGEAAGDTSRISEEVLSWIPDNVWGIETESCMLDSYDVFTDGTGDIFTDQAVDYEMISKVGDAISTVVEKLGIVSKQGKTAKVLQKRLEAEEKVAEIDKATLKLMKSIDGIKCNTSGDGKDHYSAEKGFFKRFMIRHISMQEVQINNSEVFRYMAGRYVNPADLLDSFKSVTESYAESVAEEERAEAEIEHLNEELTLLLAESARVVSAFAGDAEGCSAALSGIEAAISGVEAQISVEEEILEKYRKLSKEYMKDAEGKAKELKSLFKETYGYLEDALDDIADIRKARKKAQDKVDEYGEQLSQSRNDLTAEEAEKYGEAHSLMQEYVGKKPAESVVDYDRIEESLIRDRDILDRSGYAGVLCFSRMDSDSARNKVIEIEELKKTIMGFVYDGMAFDYSSFTQKGENSGASEVGNGLLTGINSGFLELIIKDPSTISNAEMNIALLPSRVEDISSETADTEDLVSEDVSGAGSMAGSIEDSAIEDISDIDASREDYEGEEKPDSKWGKKAIMIMYLADSFARFADDALADDTVLKYEQEYILCGKAKDKSNLSYTFMQILLMRLATCGVYVFSDPETNSAATAAATAAVGFTGMPFLVALAKYLILFVWTFEQAVVETAALAAGKRVSVLTNKATFIVKMSELVLFSHDQIQKKVSEYPEQTPGFTYQEYILIFMLLREQKTLAYRGMDLIQENLRYEYNKNFLMTNAVTSFSVKAENKIDPQFISFGGYGITTEHSIRY